MVLKLLESKELTAREHKIIEAATATARTANPDLKLLREADTLVYRLEHPDTPERDSAWEHRGGSSPSGGGV